MRTTRLQQMPAGLLRQPAVGTLAAVMVMLASIAGADDTSRRGNERGITIDVAIHAFGYSDGLPLRTAYDGFEGVAPDDSQHLLARERIELGLARGEWRLSLAYRYDYAAHYTNNTLQLLYGRHNDVPTARGRYRLRADANHSAGFALGVTRRFSVGAVEAQLRLDALRIHDFTDGRLDGVLVVAEGGGLTSDARLVSQYSKDDVLQRPKQDHAPGWGASLSLAARYAPAPGWNIALQVDDALAAVRFADAPYTRARLRLAAPRLAADGTIDSEALLSGRESARAHWQTLPVHYDLRVDYALTAKATSYGRVRGIGTTALSEFGIEWHDGRFARWRIGWLPTAGALTLGVSSVAGGQQLRIAADDTDLDSARLIEATLAARWGNADGAD